MEASAKNKGIKTYSNKYAEAVVSEIVKKNGIKKDFFYDLEKVQLILITKMFLNNCKVNQECCEEVAQQYSKQFVLYEKNKQVRTEILYKMKQ